MGRCGYGNGWKIGGNKLFKNDEVVYKKYINTESKWLHNEETEHEVSVVVAYCGTF